MEVTVMIKKVHIFGNCGGHLKGEILFTTTQIQHVTCATCKERILARVSALDWNRLSANVVAFLGAQLNHEEVQ